MSQDIPMSSWDAIPGEAAALTASAPVPPSADGAVYDLGYAPHEGPRLGRPAAIRAMVIDGTRRALGLRRKAWAKVLPWGLVGAAIVPAAWVVALTFVAAGFSLEDAGPFGDPADFFEMIGMIALLFVGLVGPTLLIPDRQHGVLAIYASRPVRAMDYLFARAATLFVLTTLIILIPHTILFFGISSLYVDGFWAGVIEHGKKIPAILGTTAAYVLAYGAPAFLVAVFVRRTAIASGVYVLLMILSASMVEAMPRATELVVFKVLAPLALFWNPLSVRDWLFKREPEQWPLDRVGLDPWVGAAAIVGIAILTGVIAHRRYRRDF
jgi:ABC-2 type transport system permease protein